MSKNKRDSKIASEKDERIEKEIKLQERLDKTIRELKDLSKKIKK